MRLPGILTVSAVLGSTAVSAQGLSAFLGTVRADSQLFTQAAIETEVKSGALVTVVPVDLKLPAKTVRIQSVEKHDKCEDENNPYWWVTTEPFGRVPADFYAPRDTSFSAGVFFPAQPNARVVPLAKLSPKSMPEGVTNKQVTAAFSLVGTKDPDVLFTWSCIADCNYRSERVFQKINGMWGLLREEFPC